MSDSVYGLHLHDAREMKAYLQSREDEVELDAIVTSPPYGDMKDYGEGEQIGQQAYSQFLEDLRIVFQQAYEMAANDATLWIVVDEYKRNGRVIRLPSDIADTVENLPGRTSCDACDRRLVQEQDTGAYHCPDCTDENGDPIRYTPIEESWELKDHIIWNKKRTLPWAEKKLRNVHEHILVFAKSPDYQFNVDDIRIFDPDELSKWWVGYPERYNPRGKIPGNIWEFDIPKQGQWGPKLSTHPSPLPYGLIERILRVSTDKGDVVLDPFAGVGTTLAVADVLGRRGIGFEVNPEYIDVFNEYIRHDASEKLLSETGTSNEQLAEMRENIWTLRIHKYGFKLAQELVEMHEADSAEALGINTVFTLINEDTLPPEDYESPKVEYVFSLDGNSPLGEVSDVHEAADRLKNGGSGGYYGLEPTFRLSMAGDLLTKIREGNWTIESNDQLHVYIKGKHHWCVRDILVQSWVRDYGTQPWSNISKNGYPPLLSNLHIQIEDESRSGSPPELDGRQFTVTAFEHTPE